MDVITKTEFDVKQQLELVQFLDIGLIVIDCQLQIKMWNSFMTNHTAIEAHEAIGQQLFSLLAQLPEDYLRRKFQSVITLQSALNITWQQRPYIFKMNSYRPITSKAEFMYQNIRIIPLMNGNAVVEHIAIAIYDVTEAARSQINFKEQNKQLKLASRIDPLTKLFNRGYWESRLEAEFKRFSRVKSSSVLVMLDIDHFKSINDTYGHQGGDAVLRALGDLLIKQHRITDIIGRYGGEEFGILLLDTTTEKAVTLVQNFTNELEKSTVIYDQQKISITLSFGITEINKDFTSHEQWIDMADKALYQSKQNGRNQLTVLNQE
ncbi:MAG: GGDEF domain-containing protein [Pseudomonadales bacterium]|nr:GGDEF domain-containing protein [Pseudomonadales bacterium]NRA17207.1 GGDEF domain-containing protein [Oceanospirillaceae bacterium]